MEYLLGTCQKNVTSEGLPGWVWSPLDNVKKVHEVEDFYNNTVVIPSCGR